MEVRCDQCQARYRVDDARVGPKGLAMRCGKCGNTFRLARDGTVTKPATPKASGIPTPGTATPLATTPSPPRTATAPGGEGPGGTPVFQPAAPPKPQPAAAKSAGAETGAAPQVRTPSSPVSVPAPASAPPVPPVAEARSQTPVAAPPTPKPSPSRPTPAPGPRDDAAIPAAPPREPGAERRAATPAPAPRVQRSPRPMQLEDAPSAGPPRALVIGVVIALVGLGVMVAVFGYWNKHRPPPLAAVEALSRARIAADKDALIALADAESQATAAIEAAPRGYPAAYAELAEIEVAWADALDDEAQFSSDRAERAGRAGDDRTKLEADGRASAFQDQAKGRLRQAFEAAVAGNRLDPRSADAALALADYYRAASSRTNMGLELKRAASP